MLVYGHRGAAGEAPENTIAGFRHAIARGVRHVEFDIRLTADDQLVVVHDDKVDRTTSDKGAVIKLTTSELASMDARRGAPPWPDKSDCGIDTLDRLIDATPELLVYNIEVKKGPKEQMRRISELLAQRFPDAEAAKRVIITSSDATLHQSLRQAAPHLERGYVSISPNPFPFLQKHQCQYLSATWTTCNLMTVQYAHRLGLKVMAWTVNDPTAIANLYRMKIHAVITDYPSMAIPLVGKLASRGRQHTD